jgi:hypothetical protein
VKPLPLRNSLMLVYTGILAVLVNALALSTHSMFVRQLDASATTSLEEKARGLHGYLQFRCTTHERDDCSSSRRVSSHWDCSTRRVKWPNFATNPVLTMCRPIAGDFV